MFMIKDLHRKLGPITHKKGLVQVAFSFFISGMIGVIYSFMIIDETIGGYIHKIFPSREGPDLHQYLPVVITVLIYSYFNQKKKRRNVLEKISFTCFQIIIAITSCIFSLILLLVTQQHFM